MRAAWRGVTRWFASFLFCGSLLFCLPSLAATAPVGATQGTFAVNQNGGATYTIPIMVPPGTAGMEPRLTLSYDQGVRSELLGVGWSIGGLSIIHRCGATIAIDGFKGGVNYDANDRFCLDGQRLIAFKKADGSSVTSSDPYWALGYEYRTERETFGKVVSYGTAGSGPSYFKVWTKDGRIHEYGVTADSRIEAKGKSTVRIWATNKTSDRKGNYFAVTYVEDNPNGEYRPKEVQYTGNGTITPYNKICFVYDRDPTSPADDCADAPVGARPDVAPRYEGGSIIKVTRRLSHIVTRANTDKAREYRLTYDNNGAVGRSRITSIVECGADLVCLPTTSIAWQTSPPSGFNGAGSGMLAAHGGGVTNNITGDFNGDGKSDLASYMGGGEFATGIWSVCLSTGVGFSCSNWSVIGAGDATTKVVGDFNGDGKTDLASYFTNTWSVCLSTGTSFSCSFQTAHSGGLGNNRAADFNGDGRTDLATYTAIGTWYVCLSTGSGFACGNQVGPWGGNYNFTTDFNGDGKSDFATWGGGTSWQICLSTNTGFSCGYQVAHGGGTSNNITADFNGDGKSDLASYIGVGGFATGIWSVCLSTGVGFSCSNWSIFGAGDVSTKVTGDFNGDGKTDLASYFGSGSWSICLSTGADFSCSFQSAHGGGVTNNITADFNGDGKSDLAGYTGSNSVWHVTNAGGPWPDVVSSIADGLGNTVGPIIYSPITNSRIYSPQSNAVYPYRDVQTATYVVVSYNETDGIGGARKFSYYYTGARAHLQGSGWLGFGSRTMNDEKTGVSSTTEYDQNYEAGTSGFVTRTTTRQSNGTRISQKDEFAITASLDYAVTHCATCLRRPLLVVGSGSLLQAFELNGSTVGCTSIDNTYATFNAAGNYGDYGSPKTVTSKSDTSCSFATAFVRTSTNTYMHDTTNWTLGLLAHVRTSHEAPGETSITRTSSFTYDEGKMTSETIEPGSSTPLTTSFDYDAFGNRIATTTTGPDITARTARVIYDTRGQFAVSAIDPLGHTPKAPATFDPRWGVVLTETDANGLLTTNEYDGFGRQVGQTFADGSSATITFNKCDATNPCAGLGNGVVPSYVITTRRNDVLVSKVYHDILDRVVRTEGVGLNGTSVYQDIWYDNLGRVARSSDTYFADQTPRWTISTYDLYDRLKTLTEPDGKVTTMTYNGLTTTARTSGSDIATRSRTTVKNVKGLVISVTDSLYPTKPTTYAYDAVGNVRSTTDPVGNVTTVTYDLRGRKTSIADPDTGTSTLTYDSLGQLVAQKDAKGQTQSVTYDLLGRMTARANPEGTCAWVYDTAANGIGKLASAACTNGYRETYTYDALSRAHAATTIIDGESFTTTTTYYDQGQIGTAPTNLGRVRTVTYPQTGFAVKRVYNSYGYLVEQRNAQTNALYWRAANLDAHGNITHQVFGNGLTTQRDFDLDRDTLTAIRTSGADGPVQDLGYTADVMGNLLSRTDRLQNISETFSYDTLDRLTAVNGPASKTLRYDALGNITYKSDVGTYQYGTGGVRPHAVASVSGALNYTYAYDTNGNLIGGAGRAFTYASFNKPTQVTVSGVTTTYTYDANFNRIKKVTPTATTVYIGKSYERITSGTKVEHKHYLSLGAATLVYTQRNIGTSDIRYLHADHLGSVDVITDEAGAVIQRLSFDAFGKRRPSTWLDGGVTGIQTTLGFTGQEMDDEDGLINLNARLYDPVIGRFLQADTVPEGMSGVDLNRYTYVGNNPLSRTDPSGRNMERWSRIFHPAGPIIQRQMSRHSYENVQLFNSVGCSFAPGYWGALCMGLSTYDNQRAHGVSEKEARRNGLRASATSAVSCWLFDCASGNYNFTEHVERAAVIYVSSESPALGAALGVLFGAPKGLTVSGYAQRFVVAAIQYEAQQYLSEWAEDHGLTLQELNILLGINSKLGLWVAGTTYDPGTHAIEGFFSRTGGIFGSASGAIGVIWDINDTFLNIQGLLDAVAQTVKNETFVVGHSLGAWRANNLVMAGRVESAYLESLPLFTFPAPGTTGACGSRDAICGGAMITFMRPNTMSIPQGGSWNPIYYHDRSGYESYRVVPDTLWINASLEPLESWCWARDENYYSALGVI